MNLISLMSKAAFISFEEREFSYRVFSKWICNFVLISNVHPDFSRVRNSSILNFCSNFSIVDFLPQMSVTVY